MNGNNNNKKSEVLFLNVAMYLKQFRLRSQPVCSVDA